MSGTWDDRMRPRPKREPRLDLVETVWRMRSPSGRILSCGIYLTDAGFEVRVGYGDDLLTSQYVLTLEKARAGAEMFRTAVRPGFEPLPAKDVPSIEPAGDGRAVRVGDSLHVIVDGDRLAEALTDDPRQPASVLPFRLDICQDIREEADSDGHLHCYPGLMRVRVAGGTISLPGSGLVSKWPARLRGHGGTRHA